ncbi:MAG: transcriptional regulator, partial [Actinomycetota bacterium]
GRLLGTHVQRLATIAHGDGVCTTHIPRGSTEGGDAQGRDTTENTIARRERIT